MNDKPNIPQVEYLNNTENSTFDDFLTYILDDNHLTSNPTSSPTAPTSSSQSSSNSEKLELKIYGDNCQMVGFITEVKVNSVINLTIARSNKSSGPLPTGLYSMKLVYYHQDARVHYNPDSFDFNRYLVVHPSESSSSLIFTNNNSSESPINFRLEKTDETELTLAFSLKQVSACVRHATLGSKIGNPWMMAVKGPDGALVGGIGVQSMKELKRGKKRKYASPETSTNFIKNMKFLDL